MPATQMTSDQVLAAVQAQWGSAQFNQTWECQDWQYWDMVGYPTGAAGPTAFTFFAVPAGQNDPALNILKTTEQTNLVNPNQIGGNEVFICTKLRCFALLAAKARQTGTGVSADADFSARQLLFARFLQVALSQGVYTWTIMDKKWQILDRPFINIPPGFGLGQVIPPAVGTGAGAAINNGANAYVNGSPVDMGAGGDTFSLAQPVFLAPNTNFQVSITQPLAGATFPANQNLFGSGANQPATLWLGTMLDGFKVRPRQ